MKFLIVYYSRTGNTEKIAERINKELVDMGHVVDMEEVVPVKEHGFFFWWFARVFKKRDKIRPIKISNVSKYNIVIFGMPNWGRVPPPLFSYLEKIKGLEYKKVGLFSSTALIPFLSWYSFSAFLLEFNFFNAINKKGGKVLETLMLSSFFRKWGVLSEYGKNKIIDFCGKISSPVSSFKKIFVAQQETENLRLLLIISSFFLSITLILQSSFWLLGKQIFSWPDFWFLFSIGFLFNFLLISILGNKKFIFIGKYIFSIFLIWGLTITYLFLEINSGKILIVGYFLVFIILIFFRSLKVIFFTGAIIFFAYWFLLSNYLKEGVIHPPLDSILLLAGMSLTLFIAYNSKKINNILLETQDELENTGLALEIKVQARTKELNDLANELDLQVKQKTEELQKKVNDLERFNNLAVGRELKMISLKKEIKELKAALSELQNKDGGRN